MEQVQQIIASEDPGNIVINDENGIYSGVNNLFTQKIGDKRYELTNHLGNVLEVITDRKIPIDFGVFDPVSNTYTSSTADGLIDYYTADVISQNDYYPFGMLLPNRHEASNEYRYGFNGYEKDDEVSGEGNSCDFGARMYNSRIGRWFTTDPFEKIYSDISTYAYALNNPIYFVDVDGGYSEPGIEKMAKSAGITLTKKQTAQLTATVMAESNQGAYDQREIAWVYLNLIKSEGFEAGMRKSSAYKQKSIWYKAYMIKLGYGEEFKDDKASARHMKVIGKDGKERSAKNIGEYAEKNGYFNSVSVKRLNKMKAFIETDVLGNQQNNPIKGWKGQGYYGDLNNNGNHGDHWNLVRQYYVLKTEGKIEGELIKVVGKGRNSTFLFDRTKIIEFFNDNPNLLPKDRSKIKKLNGTKVIG